MKSTLLQAAQGVIALAILVLGVVVGNVLTLWLLSQPPKMPPAVEPRSWTWDPFAIDRRFT